PVTLSISIVNDSPEPAEHLVIRIYIDQRLQAEVPAEPNLETATAVVSDGVQDFPMTAFSLNWSTPGKMPVWEGVQFRVLEVNFSVPTVAGDYLLAWEVRAPRMASKIGRCSLISSGQAARLLKH